MQLSVKVKLTLAFIVQCLVLSVGLSMADFYRVFPVAVNQIPSPPTPASFVADGKHSVTGQMAAGSNVLTIAESAFAKTDVGKTICVGGVGPSGLALCSTIATYISPTSVTLNTTASTTYKYVTDNTATTIAQSNVVTDSSNPFTSDMCNVAGGNGCTGTYDMQVAIPFAGIGPTKTTVMIGFTNAGSILTNNKATVSFSGNATLILGGAIVNWGTDNSSILQAAITTASAGCSGANAQVPFVPSVTYGRITLPPGRIIIGIAAGNQLLWNTTCVDLYGSGTYATDLLLAVPGPGGSCSNISDNGAQFKWNSTLSSINNLHITSINNAADCTLAMAAQSAGASAAMSGEENDNIIVDTDGEPPFARTSANNPIGVFVGNNVGSTYKHWLIGRYNLVGGFRQNLVLAGPIYGTSFTDFTLFAHDVLPIAGIFGDVNPMIDCTHPGTGAQACGQGTTISATVDGAYNAFAISGTTTGAVNLRLTTGDSPMGLGNKLEPSILWLPSTAYQQSSGINNGFVIPSSLTTVNGACAAATNTCVLTSVTNPPLFVGEMIVIPGSGSAGAATDMVTITAINTGTKTVTVLTGEAGNSACTLAGVPQACCTGLGTGTCVAGTFDSTSPVTTPVATHNYAGHAYRQINPACISGTVEPVWPTGSGATVTDGTCKWKEYGTGFQITDTSNALAGASLNIHDSFLATGLGGLYTTSGEDALDHNYLGPAFLSPVWCNGCSHLHVTHNNFSGGIIDQFIAINPDNLLFTLDNVQNQPALGHIGGCGIMITGATQSMIETSGVVCGATTALVTPVARLGLNVTGRVQYALQPITPASNAIALDVVNGAIVTATVTTTGGTTTVSNPTCAGVTCTAADIGTQFETIIQCSNGAGCDTLAFGSNFQKDASAIMPANTKSRSCRWQIVAVPGADSIQQMGACTADMAP